MLRSEIVNAISETILVIDDEAAIRNSLRDYLEDLDYIIFTAENGRAGIEIFEHEKIDLVLVDLRMPEVDGLEVLAHISQQSPDTPLIVVTGASLIGDAIAALHRGAWDYLLKPIHNISVLAHAVAKGLEKARLKRQRFEAELRYALKEMSIQQGIIAMCSFCKKIRDVDGSWVDVDAYIAKHSNSDVSHSVCPECIPKYYPEYIE